MDFLTLIQTKPIFSSLFGCLVILINYFFAYLISFKFITINNSKLNFVFFNVLLYLILSSILLFLLLLRINIQSIKFLIYLVFLFQIFYLIINFKSFANYKFNIFNNFDYLILIIITAYCFSPISDADSLDYHLGGPLDIIRNQEFISKTDEWYHFRLIGLGEMINFYGLLFYSKNFGQLFQVLAFSNILIILKVLNKNYKFNYLILLSFPLFASLLLSAKQILIVSNFYLLIFSVILIKDKILKYTIVSLIILTISPLGFKHSYLIYSAPLWISLFLIYKKNINFLKYFSYSVIVFLAIPFVFYLKNYFHYGDPVTPFLETVRLNPDLNVINFANEIRYSSKIFSLFEFPFIPVIHSLPLRLGEITLLISPLIIFCYLFIYQIRNNKIIFIYIITIFILLFLSGKSQSRFYLDFYFLCVSIFLINLNYYKNNFLIKFITILMLPYALLTILMIGYGVFSLTVPMLNSEKLVSSMNKRAHNHEVIQWINDQVSSDDYVLYYKSIRSTSFQNHKFLFYEVSDFTIDDIKKIVNKNKITKIVLSKIRNEEIIQKIKNCKFIKSHKYNVFSTRNPFNKKKNIDYIYLLDSRCL